MKAAALLAAALLAGCGRPSAPKTPQGFTAFRDPGGFFACAAPSDWRALAGQGGHRLSLFSPRAGRAPSAAIHLYHHGVGDSQFRDSQDYLAAQRALSAEPVLPTQVFIAGRDAVRFSTLRRQPGLHGAPAQMRRETHVIVPARAGFLLLVHSAPERDAATAPIFQALLDSLTLR